MNKIYNDILRNLEGEELFVTAVVLKSLDAVRKDKSYVNKAFFFTDFFLDWCNHFEVNPSFIRRKEGITRPLLMDLFIKRNAKDKYSRFEADGN